MHRPLFLALLASALIATSAFSSGFHSKDVSLETRLPEHLQQAILGGEADNCSINVIDQVAASEDSSTMFDAFYEHVDECKH